VIGPGPNRARLELTARRLDKLLDQVVFVGGQVAELLVTDPAAVRVRPTDDVDVVVAVTTRSAYYALGDELRRLGFNEDMRPGAPICRWRTVDDLVLDVMPMNEEILGFSNPWYASALETAVPYEIAPDLLISIAAAPAFLATKWAAFDDRGAGDYLGSHDLEDIISVVAGRSELLVDLQNAPADVRAFLGDRTRRFLEHSDAGDAITGALPDARFDATLISRVRARLQAVSQLA
jgi:predicted nucleotidyltransferase